MRDPDMAKLAAQHKGALARYLVQGDQWPRSEGHYHAEVELESIERAMMELPPGVPPGLVTADEVRAKATPEGLLELNTLWQPERGRMREAYPGIPEAEWADKIRAKKADEAQNRGLVKHTLDQNGFGSCASEGIAGCTMFCEEKQGFPAEPLNAFALYRYVNGGRDGGSSLSDNITAAARYGIPSERVWPRSNGWRTRLSDEAKRDALRHRPDEVYRVSNRVEFGTALLMGFVVYAGYSGHAWFAVDLIDTTRFYWKNSWGADWGDNGVGTLRFAELQWGYGCWAVRTARMASEVPDALALEAAA
ncbi:MAG: hypothetical protein V3U39_12275 [Acidimicrobiia bacterium]